MNKYLFKIQDYIKNSTKKNPFSLIIALIIFIFIALFYFFPTLFMYFNLLWTNTDENKWKLYDVEKMVYKINKTELEIKQNYTKYNIKLNQSIVNKKGM